VLNSAVVGFANSRSIAVKVKLAKAGWQEYPRYMTGPKRFTGTNAAPQDMTITICDMYNYHAFTSVDPEALRWNIMKHAAPFSRYEENSAVEYHTAFILGI
jgi:hypothetical protein